MKKCVSFVPEMFHLFIFPNMKQCVSFVPKMIGSREIPRIKTQYCVKCSEKGCSQCIHSVLFNSVHPSLCNLLTPHLLHAEHVFGNCFISVPTLYSWRDKGTLHWAPMGLMTTAASWVFSECLLLSCGVTAPEPVTPMCRPGGSLAVTTALQV